MSQEDPLTPEQRIALVEKDRSRRIGQIAITFLLIGFSLGFVGWYAAVKADENFLLYMATGMLGVVFAGIGAAFSIMGLGRTVGSSNGANNEQIALILAEIAKLKQSSTPEQPVDDTEFFEDNRKDSLEEERPEEVPPSRSPESAIGALNISPDNLQFLADRETWRKETKTIDGKAVVLVATQPSRRNKRTVYVYHVTGTNLIIYNRSRHGIFFMRIAIRPENMHAFYETFVMQPVTPEEQLWLERNDYTLI